MAAAALPPNAHEVWEKLKEIQKNIQCPICLEVLSDPYSTPCCHSYCKECIHTAIASSKKPKCPLCKEPITKRSLSKSESLAEVVVAVSELEQAIIKDTGITDTPPKVAPHCSGVTGSTGVRLHSVLHPTPLKPHPQASGQLESECGEDGERETDIENGPSTSGSRDSSALPQRKRRKLTQRSVDIQNGASSSSTHPPPPLPSSIHHKRRTDAHPSSSDISSSSDGESESTTDDAPADEALLQALEGETLRLPGSQSDDTPSRCSLRLKGKAPRSQSRPRQKQLASFPHATPAQGRERRRGEAGEEALRKAVSGIWIDSSDSDDDEAPPFFKLTTPLPDGCPILSASTVTNFHRCPEGAGPSGGPENQPPLPSGAITTPLPQSTRKSKPGPSKRGEKARQKLKQVPLELFCSR